MKVAPATSAKSEKKAVLLSPAISEVKKFVLEIPTTIVLITLSGEKREKTLPNRIKTYKELQREICTMTKNSKCLYCIRDKQNNPILSTHFKSYDLVRVKEIAVKPDYDTLRGLPSTWDRDEYGKVVASEGRSNLGNAATGSGMGKAKKKEDDDWD